MMGWGWPLAYGGAKPRWLTLSLPVWLQRDATPLLLALGAWAGALAFWWWPVNPAWWVPLALATPAVSLAIVAPPARRWLRLVALFCLAAASWWGLAAWQVARHLPHALPWQTLATQSHTVVGQLAEISLNPNNPRRATLTLQPWRSYGLPNDAATSVAWPEAIRVGVWRSQLEGMAVGQRLVVPLRVLPPLGPMMPNDRDTRLWQWLSPLSLTAYATGTLERTYDSNPLPKQQVGLVSALLAPVHAAVAVWRQVIVQATAAQSNGLVTALLVGDQQAISAPMRQLYRETGLSHLIAISGMQMTLVGLGLLGLIRALAACWPWLALRLNVKMLAAGVALVGVAGYTLLVGATPSIIRAALMVGLILVAILVGRVRQVLRAWAVAMLVILALHPAAALSAGLQLSAVATLALGFWVQRAARPVGLLGWGKASVLATVVAGAATAPVAVAHFGTQAALSLLANVVAIPLMTMATYAGFAALALWPLGAQGLGLAPMGWLVNLTSAWASWVLTWQVHAAPLGVGAVLGLAVLGVATLVTAMQKRWGWLAAVALLSTVSLSLAGWLSAPPTWVVASQGQAAWVHVGTALPARYRLVWAEDSGQATRWATRAGLSVLPASALQCCADESILPQGFMGFASMQQYGGRWHSRPLRCGRPWQQSDPACQERLSAAPDDPNSLSKDLTE